MKKSIFSKVAAAVVAGAMVLGMTVTAFAADVLTVEGYKKSDDYGDYMDMAEMVDDVSKVAVMELTVKGEANGCIVIAADSTGWGWNPVNFADAAEDNGDGTFTVKCDCALVESDNMVKITVQDWSGAGSEITKMVFKDASGAVLATIPEGADTPTGDNTAATVIVLAAVAALAVAATVSVKKVAFER